MTILKTIQHYLKELMKPSNNSIMLLMLTGGVFVFTSGFDIFVAPTTCLYCLSQRFAWSLVGFSSILYIVFNIKKPNIIAILPLIGGIAVSLYQLHQQYIAQDSNFCTNISLTCTNGYNIIFGLHIALYNLVLSLVVLAIIIIQIYRYVKKV